jgi:hypothetical protein
VTVDYDGWHAGHDWSADAAIVISQGGSQGRYTQNTPAVRMWEVTFCKGDMNNDGSVNFFDIDPFLLALFTPTGNDSSDEAFPGLLGSMIYHGDFAGGTDPPCDDALNFFDIDPFTAAVLAGCCALCGDTCESFGGGGSAAEAAEALALHAHADHLDALAVMLYTSLDSMAGPQQEFWGDVLEILGYE